MENKIEEIFLPQFDDEIDEEWEKSCKKSADDWEKVCKLGFDYFNNEKIMKK